MDSLNLHLPGKLHQPAGLSLSAKLWQQMKSHVEGLDTEEVCGMIAGHYGETVYRAEIVVPIRNELHSPTRYRMDPQEQLDALLQFEEQGLDLVAIYHSHPNGPERPSSTDAAEAYYPEAIQLIWSQQAKEWGCRAFLVREGRVREIVLQQSE